MEYIFTERSHLMCPNMFFGLCCVVKKSLNEDRIHETISKLSEIHPFLRSTLGYEKETNRFFYNITENSKVRLNILPEDIFDINDNKIIDEYTRQTNNEWNLLEEGMLRIIVWKKEDKMYVLFIFHHLLADGKGGLELVQEFVNYYCDSVSVEITSEKLITEDDLPSDTKLSLFNQILIKRLNQKWIQERKKITYEEYLNIVNTKLPKISRNYNIKKFEGINFSKISDSCKENNITINDYFLSKMFIENATSKIIIACDLRNKFPSYKKNTLGNYSTAFSISYKANTIDIIHNAKKIHKIVIKKRNNVKDLFLILQFYAKLNAEIIDAALISSKEFFNSRIAKFTGDCILKYKNPTNYSITNLGKIENRNIETACFIPPASPAIKKIQGILTVNENMIVCTCEKQ